MEFSGSLNYLNKDGNIVFSEGVSGSLSVPVGPVTVGGGAGGSTEKTYKEGEVVSEKVSGNGGVSVGPVNVTAAGELETDKTTGKDKTTTAITGGIGGALGVGYVVEGKVEAGAKVEVKD